MAGLVVASAVLKEVLSTLKSLVLDEFWLLWGVKKEKDKLQSYLETIEAVLQDAERRQVKEMTVKNWLRKIKDAAHDAEDVLDEFRIEALRRKVENQAAGMRNKVSKLFYPPVFRFNMAHKMQKLMKNFEHIAKERDLFSFTEGVVDSQPRISRARETCSKIASEVYGRDTEKADLIDLLIKSESENEEGLSVIPIVGMGGVGKTTLAQLVYNDEQVVNHFNKLRMWVYVSENFDVGKLLKEILECAIKGPTEQLSMELLQTRLQNELSGKRYLLVLDDVWNDNANEWYRLKALLTCGANGSKLLVTTRHDAVAKIMHAVPRPRLGIVSNEESWNLFQKLANPPPMCVAIGQEMVEKCDGLPLAITTLGGLMSSKETVSEWESVRDSKLWNSQDNGGGILPILQLSYDHLTPSLKQCFAFCAVIPKGHSIFKQRLIKQWIALGFIYSVDENELLEEKAEGYFSELLQRSLFQDSNDSNEPFYDEEEYYKMHDLIHDLVSFVGEKECFIAQASMDTIPKETRHLTVQGGKWAREPENLEALKKCEKLRSMSTYGHCFVDLNAFLSLTCLRVLDLNSQYNISYLPNSIDKLKHLRYLDISCACITTLPETICNLHSLQTLIISKTKIRMLPKNMERMVSLRHIDLSHTIITELPETISNLHSLQTLIISHTEISMLPENMKRMVSLRNIELDRLQSDSLLLPKGIGELTCLRTLSTFVVGLVLGAGIEELRGLNQLCGDFCIRRLHRVRDAECAREANLKAKIQLHSLRLSWDGTAADTEGNSEKVIENLEPHSRLKKLAVDNYMGMKFPNWMQMLTNLTDIKLSDCDRCEHLPPLWRLPFLESLELRSMSAVKYIVEFDGSDNSKDIFPRLEHLQLHVMLDLEGWSSQQEDGDGDEQGRERDGQVILQGLRTLKINWCPKLSLFDMHNLERWSVQEAGAMIFSSLRDLQINACPNLSSLPQLLLPALEMLHMSNVSCDKIEFSTSHSLRSVCLFNMPNLERLSLKASNDNEHVVFCPIHPAMIAPDHYNSRENQISLPGDGIESISADTLQNLTSLQIKGCPKLWSSLVSLENLKSVESLNISGCPDMTRLLGSMENFTSLTRLSIAGCPGMWSLPMKNLRSLTQLRIADCPGISSLPESMGDLTLLRSLMISNCPGVKTLPNGLKRLGNLHVLQIDECPNLKRKLRFPKGQDWHKVEHVRNIWIDWVDPR